MKKNQLAIRQSRLSITRKESRRRRLRVECLEDRRLLAFDVAELPLAEAWSKVEASDLNQDGFDDFVLVRNNKFLVGSHGSAIGSAAVVSENATNLVSNDAALALGLGDSNSDGKLDVLIGKNHTGVGRGVLTFEGDNAYGFEFAEDISNGGYYTPIFVETHDFNQDGINEIITSNFNNSSNGGVTVIFSDGTIRPLRPWPIYHTNGYNLIIDDLNQDGFSDIAVPVGDPENLGPTGLAIMLSDGGTNFSQSFVELDSSEGQRFGVSADLDGDGAPEILVADTLTNSVHVYQNNGAGGFSTVSDAFSFAGVSRIHVMEDLPGSDSGVRVAVISRSVGVGVFSYSRASQQWAHEVTLDGEPSYSNVGDFNGDGNNDIVVIEPGKLRFFYSENGAKDYGDAPAPYPVTLEEDGARHGAIGPQLGSTRTLEANGIHSDLADADTDDGVTFGELRVGQTDATVTVNVQNAPLGAKLDAWLDFNGDGNWGGPNEQIFSSLSVVNGDNVLHFEIPANASKGNTYARFRLSSDEGIGITGAVSDGEVEDYVLEIKGKPSGVGDIAIGPQTVVDSTKDRPTEVAAGDIDGDGDIDLLVASAFTGGVIWYENIGEADFSAHSITSSPNSMRAVEIADLDGDGDQDFLSASSDDNTIAWYQNDGAQNFTRFVISSTASGANDVRTGDFNSDGLIDVVSFSSNDNSIRLFLNQGTNSFDERLVDSNSIGAWQGHIVDVNGDGKLDILSASMGDNTVSAFLGDGSGEFTKQVIDSGISSVRSVIALDIDNDGDQDILSASATGNRLVLNENQSGTFVDGSTFVDGLNHPLRLYSTDLDGDTNTDILVTLSNDGSVVWLEQEDSTIRQRIISDQTLGSRSVIGADIDQDGDIDVISASYSDDKIAWYENLWANYSPTLDTLVGLTIDEDAAEQTVNLTGISAGGGESQPLKVSAVSSNTGLILDPTVAYTSAEATGTLKFTPVAEQSGVTTITVTVEDGGLDLDLATTEDNAAFSRTFDVTVDPINDPPTLADYSVRLEHSQTSASFLYGMTAADFNNDGLDDFVGSYYFSPNAGLHITPGSATHSGETTFYPLGNLSKEVQHADIDGDGDMDLIASNYASHSQGDGRLYVLKNDGTGSFITTFVNVPGSSPAGIARADFDNDGDVDVAMAMHHSNTWRLLNNDGTGTFTVAESYGVATPEDLVAADVNSDGWMDVVSTNLNGDQIVVFLNDQNGGFNTGQQIASGDYPSSIAVGDFNGDNHIDLVVSNQVPDTLSLFTNNGAGTFSPADVFTLGDSGSVIQVAINDWDKDGVDDIIALSSGSPGSTLFFISPLNGTELGHSVPNGGVNVVTGDFDGDSQIEYAVSTWIEARDPSLLSFYELSDIQSDLEILEDASEITKPLGGIGPGPNETQHLRVTATSSDETLIPNPDVTYTTPDTDGLLKFAPVANANGNATITVTVEDAGLDNDLGTTEDNATFSRSFDVTVNPVNDAPTLNELVDLTIDEDAAEQTVNLTGISAGGGERQPLRVTSSSSDTNLIPNPNVEFLGSITSGLVGYFPFDGSAVDESGNGRDGVVNGAVLTADRFGVADSAYRFDGVNDRIDWTDSIADSWFEGKSKLSIALWVKPLVGTSTKDVFFEYGVSTFGLEGKTSAGQTVDFFTNNSSPVSTTLDVGEWNHVVLQIDGTNKEIYKNGVLTERLAFTNAIDGASLFALGGRPSGGLYTNSEFDELRIYDRALSGEEISHLFEGTDTEGDLAFTPVAHQSGTATITVTVEDGGLDLDLATTADNSTFTRTFDVTVNPLNDTPTLDELPNLTIDEDSAEQTVNISGISAGGGESQPLRVTATSSNTGLILDPTITYTSADSTGKLQFITIADQSGVTTVTVTAEDGGLDLDLATTEDNAAFSRTFDVTVNPVNDVPTLDELPDLTIDEDAAEQTVNLTGIRAGGGERQPLRVTASSGDTTLIPNPVVQYPTPSWINNDLLAYYPFDGNADDASGNGRNGVANGATPTNDRLGVNNSAYQFDGVDDYIRYEGQTVTSNPFTWSVWFKLDSVLSTGTSVLIAQADDPGQNRISPVLKVANGVLAFSSFDISSGGNELADDEGSQLATDQWYHAVISSHADGKRDLYLDGDLAATGTWFSFGQVLDNTYFGVRGGLNLDEALLDGSLDEARIYSRALSPAEVFELYQSNPQQGKLSLQPNADAFGTSTITVNVEDGGLDLDLATAADNATFSRTFDVTVNAVNDPPVLATLPEITMDEDGVVHGNGTNLNLFASDIDSDESKLEFRIVNLAEIDPQFGLSIGMDPQSDSFAVRGDSSIHVHPAANFFGSAQVIIEARDPEGDVSQQETFNLVINAVNDPPVLDPASTLSLSDLVEDSGAPVGQVGTLVSTLIDENGPLSNYNDVDGIAPGIAVVGKNIAVEKIWFTTNDGQNWQEAGSVSDAGSLVLDADETTRIYLKTADDFSGDLADAVTIKAWDQTGGYSNGQVGVDSSAIAFSSQTDTVAISVEPSPSSAADDFYAPAFDSVETLVINKADLLANDTFGNGESIETVTITADATSAAGGTVTVDGDQFTYTRPANWFSGIDTFSYTLDDGGSTSTATVTILSGLQGDTLTITLEPGRDHEVTLQYADEKLVLMDHVTQETLLNIPKELVPANIDVIGAPANSNIVTFSELSDSEPSESSTSWSYQGGSANDELAVLGSGSQWAWLSSDPQVEYDVTVDLKLLTTLIDSYKMIAVEKVSVGQVDRVEFSDPYLEVGTQTFDLVSTKPVNLPTDVTISEGILRSSTPIGLHTAKSLVGSGQVDAAFGGGASSLIRATGDLAVGSNSDSDGFRTYGRLEVGANTVTLLDSNQAELGSLTTLGTSQPGTLHSDFGFILEFGDNLEGFGTIETLQGDSGGPLINNGNIIGNSSEQPITINAKVKGVGTFDHVVMNGEFTPGFSPALWKSGTVTYTDANRFVIELGGRLAGSEFDRVEHYLAKLGGTLDVQLIDSFKPLLGDLFEVITSAQPFEGDFSEVLLPLRDNGVRVRELLGQHGIELETVFDVTDTLEVLKSQVADYQIAGHDGSGLKVQGDRFRAFVTSQHEFVAEHPWHTEQLELEAGKLVQIATDGVNRLIIEGSNWKNFVEPSDVNNDQNVTALDALTVINELGRRSHSDDLTSALNDAAILVTGAGHFYDQNGDGKCTALDALRVINDLARSSVSGEGESVTADYLSGGSDAVWSQDTESDEEPLESRFEGTELIYSDADPETPHASDRPEDLVYAAVGQESTEAMDSLFSDLEDWWK